MTEIVRIKYGAELYGLETPSSDIDIKGVFLPSKEDLLLGKIPKSISTSTKSGDGKNSKDDVDTELYSLHYFIHLACEGETVALDMIHAPKEMCVYEHNPIGWMTKERVLWEEVIVKNRHRFYTKNLKAFLGYCRTQSHKYEVKGSRLAAAKGVLDTLNSILEYLNEWRSNTPKSYAPHKLLFWWYKLPEGEHTKKYFDPVTNLNMYEVCGRKIQETASVEYAYDIVKRFYENYGERARKAQNNDGIDWKALSHAIRVAEEMKEVYEDGTITFPLKEREFIMKVKLGELDYTTIVAPKLDELIDEVEILAAKSNYPEKVDRNYWDKFIIKTMEDYVL